MRTSTSTAPSAASSTSCPPLRSPPIAARHGDRCRSDRPDVRRWRPLVVGLPVAGQPAALRPAPRRPARGPNHGASTPRSTAATSSTTCGEVVDGIEASCPLVVFHSWVAAYLSPQQQGQLVETVRGAVEVAAPALPLCRVAGGDPRAPDAAGSPFGPHGGTGHRTGASASRRHSPGPPGQHAPHGNWLHWWVYSAGPHGASRRAGTGHPLVRDHGRRPHGGAAELAADGIDWPPSRPATTARARSHSGSFVAAVAEVEGQLVPAAFDQSRRADPEKPDPVAGVDPGQERCGNLSDGTTGGDGPVPWCASGSGGRGP